jgi:hypothetical protein
MILQPASQLKERRRSKVVNSIGEVRTALGALY